MLGLAVPRADMLRRVAAFSQLAPGALHEVAGVTEYMRLPAGARVFDPGERVRRAGIPRA